MKKVLENQHIVLWALFLAALMVRGWGLSAQPPLIDEATSAFDATNYMQHGLLGQVMWYHPQLRNIVVYLSGQLFGGFSAWGLRFGSLLLGSLTIPVLGYLCLALFRRTSAAYLAAFFLCIDPLHIMLSREAFQETTTCFFIVSGVLAAFYCIRDDRVGWGYLAGILFGLASASKWHGLFPWFLSAVVYLLAPWIIPGYPGDRGLLRRSIHACAAFIAIPVTVYVTVHIPWLLRGYSLAEFADLQLWLARHQYVYKSEFYTEGFLSHRAYQWFLWPVAWVDFVFSQGKTYLGIGFGNMIVWWLTLPALVYGIRKWFFERSLPLLYVVLLFLISYLPLILTSRSIWVFAAPAVLPFAFLLSANAISGLLDSKKISNRLLWCYLAVALGVSAVLYPMATFKALDYPFYGPLTRIYSPHQGGPAQDEMGMGGVR
jgi:4-amino-4-deoxy-L-arabinose transferase-like glycosyltransferase